MFLKVMDVLVRLFSLSISVFGIVYLIKDIKAGY